MNKLFAIRIIKCLYYVNKKLFNNIIFTTYKQFIKIIFNK